MLSDLGGQDLDSVNFDNVVVSIADPLDGCVALTNTDMAGKIALIRRGVCTFTSKILNAQTAGAVAVILYNDHRAGTVVMGGTEPLITIPSVFMDLTEGAALNAAVTADATTAVSIHCADRASTAPRPTRALAACSSLTAVT